MSSTRKSGQKPRYDLYFVSAEIEMLGRNHLDTLEAAISGGATIVQLRDKSRADGALREIALSALELARKAGVPLVINDRIEVAAAVRADGVHLGQDDSSPILARELLGENAIIGVSASTVDEAQRAEAEGADYLGVGPVFPTTSKPDAVAHIGLDGLARIREVVSIPIVAIGGITREKVADLIRAGADGIAVIAAIAEADDMVAAARGLRDEVAKALRLRKGARPGDENFDR